MLRNPANAVGDQLNDALRATRLERETIVPDAETITIPNLEPDCDACAALCCVGLAFDAGEEFAIDKPAGLPCPHLSHHACTIYDRLETEGFSGCVTYDCQGAGQRTLALYDGVSWQTQLDRLGPMLETFRHLRRLHEIIALLDTASQLPLEDDEDAARTQLMAPLCDPNLSAEQAEALANGPLPANVSAFLRSLSHHV